jgi:hypothetical protein
MAGKSPKTKRAEPELAVLLQAARARLDLDGALKLTTVGTKATRDVLVSQLVAQGFEVTKTMLRTPLDVQLTTALSNGAFIPLKAVASHVMGATAAEAKQAVLALVAAGSAKLVLRSTEQVVVPSRTSVLSGAELARFAEIAKLVAKTAKSGASLLRSDLEELLTKVLPDVSLAASHHEKSPQTLPARHKTAERAPLVEPPLVGRLLSAVDATRDSRTGLSFVPTIVKQLRPELDAKAAAAMLVAAAGEGLLELRPEGGINRLSEEELSMCPPGPQGTRLSWVRRTEGVAR